MNAKGNVQVWIENTEGDRWVAKTFRSYERAEEFADHVREVMFSARKVWVERRK